MAECIMTDVFTQAVEKHDIAKIRTCIAECINRDPTLKAYEDYIKYIDEKDGNHKYIVVDYEKRPDEYQLPEEEWNDLYFYSKVEWFRLNFAPEERIEEIKEIGNKVFPEINFQIVPEGRRDNAGKKSSLPILLIVAAIAISIIILIMMAN